MPVGGLAVFAMVALGAGCICAAGDPSYRVEVFAEDAPALTADVEWGGMTRELGSAGTAVRVVLPHSTEYDGSPELIEIYDEARHRILVPGR